MMLNNIFTYTNTETCKSSFDFNDLLNMVNKLNFEETHIIFSKQETIDKFDMKNIPKNIWFIANNYLTDDKTILIVDKELKKSIYDSCKCGNIKFIKGEKDE